MAYDYSSKKATLEEAESNKASGKKVFLINDLVAARPKGMMRSLKADMPETMRRIEGGSAFSIEGDKSL